MFTYQNQNPVLMRPFTWTIGYAAAILALIFSNLVTYEVGKAAISLSTFVVILSGAGLVLCLYSWFILRESRKHIKSNWDRADFYRLKIDNLDFLFRQEKGSFKNRASIPIGDRLSIMAYLLAGCFLFVLFYAWVYIE